MSVLVFVLALIVWAYVVTPALARASARVDVWLKVRVDG